MRPTRTRPIQSVRAVAVLAFVLATPLALAACSSPSDPTARDTAGSGIGAKWGECMRDAGFEVEDPADALIRSGAVMIPPGVDQDRYRGAARTCNEELGIQGADAAQKERWQREYAKVDSCIREEYPDAPEQRPGVLDYSAYPRAQEPAFDERLRACTKQYAPDTRQLGE